MSYEPLTVTYEQLRHAVDAQQLHEFARTPLPDRADQASFSRATALLEAVAGNAHTPIEDRTWLATVMPFPNVLVKLSQDDEPSVRAAVAANVNSKNWLVGRLTKDAEPSVRDAALRNPQASWKMRLEGAQNPNTSAQTLDFLAYFGIDETLLQEVMTAAATPEAVNIPQDATAAPIVLARMVRRAVALNPTASQATLERLARDEHQPISELAQQRLHALSA